MQTENQINQLIDEPFEHVLKRISIPAFDALLTCGVRGLTGLMRLTAEDLSQVGIPPRIITELMGIQLQLREHTTKLDKQKNVIEQDNAIYQAIPGEQQEYFEEAGNYALDLQTGSPIPNELIARLPTRARNVLTREKIMTIERLLEFQEKDLFDIAGIGRKTVFDIKQLQNKVTNRRSQISQTSVKDTLQEKPACQDHPSFFPRVRFHPRTSEHWLSDPADWSLLSRTLPDLFWVTLTNSNFSDNDENVAIGDLGISASDICKFREIALFPEDTADLLFSISLGSLLQVRICDSTFSIMLDYLEHFTGHSPLSKIFVSSAKASDTPVFADIQTDLIEAFRIPRLLYQDLFEIIEYGKSAITWGDVAKLSERNVIKHFGFTMQGLKAIQFLWQLKEHALKIIKSISTGLSTETYSSFSNLVDAFVQSIIKKDYHYPVIMGRLGFLDERKWTLEELGQRLNLTRERIRQIEKKYVPVLENPKVLDRLNLLWYAVDDSLKAGGGVCCISEIADSFKTSLKWTTLPSGEALASLISLSAKYEVVWVDPIRIIMPNHGCVNCSEIGPVLTRAVESQPNGILSFDEAIEVMREFCQCQSCNNLSETHRFSKGFLHFLDDAIEEILADESNLYTQYAWGVKYGMRRTALVEQIILNAEKPMHFKEVHIEANKERSLHAQLSERSIYGNLERSSALLLWGPGTFIHKDFISLPIQLLSEIENDIISRLNTQNIPYLCITGIFEVYKESLLEQKVPNANALYSCMRITNNHILDCPDYPYVLKRESDGLRLPIPLVLEAYILEQEGTVTLDLIKNYAINNLCVNEAVFMISHLPSIPNLLRISSSEYIHLCNLGVTEDQLIPIIDHLRKLLEKHDHVAANLLFNERRISCRLLGISTPMLLFSLIQLFYSDEFELSRFPSIRLLDARSENNRASGVSLEVVAYIRNKSLPCSFLELYKHFVDKLGYNQNTVNYIMYQYKNILRYSTGVMVHLESLNWTEEKQSVLEMLAINHLNDRNNSGKTFGLISHIFEYMYDKLPELTEQIAWIPTLIGELLSSEGKFRIIGTSRNAFVPAPNAYSIETLDDLLYYILNTEYDGAENIDKFISDMREAGILVKNLVALSIGDLE